MKNKIIFSLLSVLLFSVSSCKKDYLETAPTDQVDNTAVFTTTQNANTALNGIYRYMFQRYGNQNQPGVGGMLLVYDFLGDDIGQATVTWFTAEGSWNSHRAEDSGLNSYAYRFFYRIIGNANYIIDNIDTSVGGNADKSSIKAEALTLRAYAYSYLVQMFGKRYDASAKPNTQLGVPLLISSLDTKLPRSTVEEVYTQINKDLDEAIALNISTRVNKSHINAMVARGLRARVALTMQDYPNAIKFAKEVIDSGLFPLMTSAAYQSGFNDAPSLSEFMWASIPAADQADTFGSFFSQIAFNANTTYMRGNPKRINSNTYSRISNTDVRSRMWEPAPNATNFPLPTTGFQRFPFMSRKFAVKVVGQPTLGDVPLMRSAEMFLILAEAYAMTAGQGLNARTTLFSLVSRRDPSAVISTRVGQAFIDEILFNRRIELWGEGFRWLDLKRLNLSLDRSPSAFPNYVPLTMNGTVSIPAGDVRWQFLIPRAEMEANLSLVGQQNP